MLKEEKERKKRKREEGKGRPRGGKFQEMRLGL
jgi:hypothetical protein